MPEILVKDFQTYILNIFKNLKENTNILGTEIENVRNIKRKFLIEKAIDEMKKVLDRLISNLTTEKEI
jgi:hypothetical protein